MVSVLKRLFSVNAMLKENQKVDGRENLNSPDIYKKALMIAWPSAVEAFLVGLVSLINMIMVGELGGDVGTRAIAAIGITGQPRMIIFCLVFSLNVGVTAVVARCKGSGNQEKANDTLRQALMVCAGIVLVMVTFGIVFSTQLMELAGAKEDTIDFATEYFRITTFGFIFTAFGMVINAAQRGVGNTRMSMITNLTANAVTIVFNFLLISGNLGFPKLMVKGAAISTLIGNIVMFLICVISVRKKGKFLHLQFKKTKWEFTSDVMLSVANVSLSAFVEQIFMRIGFFMYARFVADLGTAAMSTHNMCMSILNLSFTFGDGLGIAASSLVGQSLGAKKPDMAIIYGKVSQRIALMISAVLVVVFIVFRYNFMTMFTDKPDIIAAGMRILIVLAITSPFQTSQVVISGSLRGAGDTRYVAVTSFICIALIRPVVTWVLCYPAGLGLIGAWLSLLLDQILRLILNFTRFAKGKWTAKMI